MAERVRWVTKAEAARELEMSLSTLDRKIRSGEFEVRRKGRRVYVRLEGPEYVSDDELLRRSLVREDKLQRRGVGAGWAIIGVGAGAGQGPGRRVRQRTGVRGDGGGVPEGDRRARRDEGSGHRAPRDRRRTARAADRQRSPVVVCAEVGPVSDSGPSARQMCEPLAWCWPPVGLSLFRRAKWNRSR